VRERGWLRTAIASLTICAIGGALLWRGTDGLRALTTEQARRDAIEKHSRVLPVVALDDQDGNAFTLDTYRGRPAAVDFVYTQCVSVCTLLSAGFQRLDRAQQARNAEGEVVRLVSISFDPRDTPARLREYASRYGADGHTWRFAKVHDSRELTPLLRAFGIVVIPDGRGDFQHNAAIHVLDASGRLARVFDVGAESDTVLRAARSLGR